MAKLHELLAVEGDLEGAYKQSQAETTQVFKEKPAFFYGFEKRLEMFAEDAQRPPVERQELVHTVHDKLQENSKNCVRYFDSVLKAY